MSSSELKSGISKLMQKINDERFLRTMYAMVSEYAGVDDFEPTASQKQLMDKRKKSHQAGTSKSYSVKEVKALVLKNVK